MHPSGKERWTQAKGLGACEWVSGWWEGGVIMMIKTLLAEFFLPTVVRKYIQGDKQLAAHTGTCSCPSRYRCVVTNTPGLTFHLEKKKNQLNSRFILTFFSPKRCESNAWAEPYLTYARRFDVSTFHRELFGSTLHTIAITVDDEMTFLMQRACWLFLINRLTSDI